MKIIDGFTLVVVCLIKNLLVELEAPLIFQDKYFCANIKKILNEYWGRMELTADLL